MIDALLAFAAALRNAGIGVSVSEDADALEAARVAGMGDREVLRSVLAATLVKSQDHREAFDVLFDLHFGARPAERPEPQESGEDLLEQIADAVGRGDAPGAQGLAGRAVDAFGEVTGSPTGTRYYAYPVLRALDPGTLMARVRAAIASESPGAVTAALRTTEAEAAMAALRAEIQREVNRRQAAERGAGAVARYAVTPLPEDVDLLSGSRDEIEAVRRAIRPLARKLASRVELARRRSNRGSLDVRRTLRRSLSSGGVPISPAFRHRAPRRPELVILCDLSDSVGRFARFSLMLVHALSSQFERVRSFAFVDALDEVTDLFDDENLGRAVENVNARAKVVAFENRTDYGAALESFWKQHGRDVTGRTTVLILGDARNNNRDSEAWVLRRLRRQARHVYWLNPEPRAQWDTGDSIAGEYARVTDGMIEVRTLRQLEDFVASLEDRSGRRLSSYAVSGR